MKTTNKVLHAIAELNLEPIKNKLMDAESGEGWSRAKADAMDLEYRRFLHLMHTFPNQPASPTKAVDTFWHYHILDTQKYAADCDEVFGCFMHHNPYGDEQETSAGEHSVDRMREMYEATFGEAYIRAEAYYLDEDGNQAASDDGGSSMKAEKMSAAKAAVCQTFCMIQAKQAGAKAAVCQTFCMIKAEPAGAKAAVCQTFCMMQSKAASAPAVAPGLRQKAPAPASANFA